MGDNGLQRIVDTLAERIGRSVAINDPSAHLMCASKHFGDEDEVRVHAMLQREAGSAVIDHMLAQGITRWAEPGVIPPRDDLRMLARFCVPVRWEGLLLGFLIVIGPDSLSEEQVEAITAAASSMAAVLYRDFLVEDAGRAAREEAVLGLLGDTPERRIAAQRTLEDGGWPRSAPWATVSVVNVVNVIDAGPEGNARAPAELALRTALEPVARKAMVTVARAAFTVTGDSAILLQLDRTPMSTADLREQSATITRQVRLVLGGNTRCLVGVGAPANGLSEAWHSRRQAATAAEGAGVLGSPGGVAFWDELGAYTALLQLPPDRLGPWLLPKPLRDLVGADHHGRLVETLAAYLDNAGSSPATAATLHIHRTSLYYRLHQIEQLTGLDLADGDTRLTMHLGLRLLALLPSTSANRSSPEQGFSANR
ncbi:helix-turn-helix domain-containing protein [Saccharomonospora sp. NPDC006951]